MFLCTQTIIYVNFYVHIYTYMYIYTCILKKSLYIDFVLHTTKLKPLGLGRIVLIPNRLANRLFPEQRNQAGLLRVLQVFGALLSARRQGPPSIVVPSLDMSRSDQNMLNSASFWAWNLHSLGFPPKLLC